MYKNWDFRRKKVGLKCIISPIATKQLDQLIRWIAQVVVAAISLELWDYLFHSSIGLEEMNYEDLYTI